MNQNLPSTLGELKSSGYISKSIKSEIRSNLVKKLAQNDNVFPNIIGFQNTVIPQIQNAILAGQDIILLGERGQAKSRIIRNLLDLLDDEIPYVQGSEINDDPLNPITSYAKEIIEEKGDSTPIEWLNKEKRYSEKLATPDVSVSDLIGEIDPIKIAEGRYLSDELAIHYGMIPRGNRGIFCINELPDLTERIQVSLFNLMQERDIQIKGFQIRLPLDMLIVATANPEDYTNRGRIITPLKDRYGAQIRTHYPSSIEEELNIIEQEYRKFDDSENSVLVPEFMREIVAEITHLSRKSPEINQSSGVSLRVSIANYETLISQAFRRTLITNSNTSPRICDLEFLIPSTMGKVELETVEEGQENSIISNVISRAVLNVFNSKFNLELFDSLINHFQNGLSIEVGSEIPESLYLQNIEQITGLSELLNQLGESKEKSIQVSMFEFILEGLHLSKKLNKNSHQDSDTYSV
tara:strand:+ start:125 stop:1522 length:1398 start_codon:yes stop_codon:yes gene_type:complete